MSAGIKGTVSRDIYGIFLCLWIGQSLIKNRSWFLNCQRTCLTFHLDNPVSCGKGQNISSRFFFG